MTPRGLRELACEFDAYVDDVLDGCLVVGRLVRLAVERHVRDCELGEKRGLRFNARRGLRACWWIENRVRHPKTSKATRAGERFRLARWQVFVVACVFGWERRRDDGRWVRRFRTAYLCVARKNGKSMTAAAIALLCLVLEGAAGGEVYSAATKRDQAAYCWNQAAESARREKLLAKEIEVRESRHHMVHRPSGSVFTAVASDAHTLDGLGPSLAIIDEYHEHPTSEVADVLRSGMGASPEPLTMYTTTAGGKREGPCYELETDCCKILEGVDGGEGDDVFAFIARPDDTDLPGTEAAQRKANPNLGVTVHLEDLAIQYKTAVRRPREWTEYLRKHENRWTETSSAWLPMPDWDACNGKSGSAFRRDLLELALERLRGERCFVGVDLSAVADYTATCKVFPRPADCALLAELRRELGLDVAGSGYIIAPSFWIPADTLIDRAQRDRVPVTRWVEDGLVTATPGNAVDHDAVKDSILSDCDRYDVVEVPMDPHNATKLQTELMALGVPVLSMRQGWITMSPAIKATETQILQRRLIHFGHPVQRWMFSNVACVVDKAENKSLHKGKSGDRIDGQVAEVMAIGRAEITDSGGIGIYFAAEGA